MIGSILPEYFAGRSPLVMRWLLCFSFAVTALVSCGLSGCRSTSPNSAEEFPAGYHPLNFSASANMGFVDAEDNDGAGGWLDDGEGDLRFFLVNLKKGESLPETAFFNGIPFQLTDPSSNRNKSILVFGSARKPSVKLRSAGPFSVHRKAASLWMLHATGWGGKQDKAAEYKVVYDDGSSVSFDLINGKNIGDWYRPAAVPEAEIGWSGGCMISDSCGLFLTEWKNPYPEKTIRTLSLRGGFSNSMYALVGLTFSDRTAVRDPARKTPNSLASIHPKKRPPLPARLPLNPLKFPDYRQILSVTFASPAAAEKATLSVLPLPGNRPFAFTTRWDDCSSKHKKQAEIMAKHGFRGTFMLCNFNDSYRDQTARFFKQFGCTAGNHSYRHIRYEGIPKNEIYNQIVKQQLRIESALDAVSISYVFPGGMGNPSREEAHLAGRVMNASGIYSSPFMSPGTGRRLGLDPRRMFMTFLFHANDKMPDSEQFERNLAWAETLSMNDPEIPRITYGLHTWMDDRGFEKLDRIYASRARQDSKYWYANENEYGAYRYSFYNANPVKAGVSGTSAEFVLNRFSPASLGAETPIEIAFSEKPLSVRLNGKRLLPESNGFYRLPHDPGKRMPAKVDLLEKSADSVKFPGLFFNLRIDPEKNTAELIFRNESKEELKDLSFLLLVPPRWEDMTHRFEVRDLSPGKSFSRTGSLGKRVDKPDYRADEYLFVGKVDFSGVLESGRLYRSVAVNGGTIISR